MLTDKKFLDDLKKVMTGLIRFPDSHVCKHFVVCELLELLQNNGIPVSNETVSAVVSANDKVAIKHIKMLNIPK